MMEKQYPAGALTVLAILLLCAACSSSDDRRPPLFAGEAGSRLEAELSGNGGLGGEVDPGALQAQVDVEQNALALEEIAEMERSGGFVPGLGLAESNLKEARGDYAGAVIAVYKELSWAYSRGEGGVTRDAVNAALNKVLELGTGPGAAEASRAALAFFNGRWKEAETALKRIFSEVGSDDFSRWMLLVCAMEQGDVSREIRGEYSAIRARYAAFPEYWYRGARCFSTLKANTVLSAAGAYAERCVNLAAGGPFAAECRSILAETSGLAAGDGISIKTQSEIEGTAGAAVRQARPELLAELLPLVALPDNPYTLYASGILKALAADEQFRGWFSAEAAKANGRLAERLLYIARG
ncbi:MAG: hypothetical protein LBI67_03365 [Treponema sp.]|nr:hypothetical protein [Treponema sp.]